MDPQGNLLIGAQSADGLNGTFVSLRPSGVDFWRRDAGAVTGAISVGERGADGGTLTYAPIHTASGATVNAYNVAELSVPDLLICRPELVDACLAALTS